MPKDQSGEFVRVEWYLSTVRILVPPLLDHPEDGLGLQQAILERVSADMTGPTALLWTSSPYVGATRPETRMSSFQAAADFVENAGFPVLVRNSGGGAVAANEGSLSFSLTFPVTDLRHGLFERYAEGVEFIVAALARVGVEAEGGAVEGEFCPGEHSVRSGGLSGTKHAGLAQRVTRRAARLEALVLVTQTAGLVPVLSGFYRTLGLPFRPESVADTSTTVPEMTDALVAEVRERYGGEREPVERDLVLRAGEMRDRWRYMARRDPA